jgi:predicted PurR-regulated permease PerM
MKQTITYDISWSTIAKIVLTLFGIWFVVQVRDILVLLFIVGVIVAALSPVVDRWSKRLPRWLATLTLFLIVIIFIAGAITLLIPPFIKEGGALIAQMIDVITLYLPQFRDELLKYRDISNLSRSFTFLGGQIYGATLGFFGVLVAIITMTILTFYLLLEQHRARDYLKNHLPPDKKEAISRILQKISQKLGAWVRSQLVLGIIIGIATFIALLILRIIFNMPYTLTLAIWAGLTELVPYIGPALGAIPAVVIGFNISPLVGLIVILIYTAIQQLESNIIVPKVMQKAVGLSPVTIIVVLLIGGKLAGFIGIILAVPAAAVLSVILQERSQIKKIFSKN